MMNELVSIIIPTYNGYDNLARAVDSCLKQTYQNIEVFVVDDNGEGTENQIKTQEVMEKYKDCSNVNYLVHPKNINGSAARNTGIKASSGEYIAFLDDDDEYLPENLEKHIQVLANKPGDYAMSYCGKKLITSNPKPEIIMPPYDGDILFDFLCSKMRIGSSFMVVRRSAVEEVNGFDESFRRHQDWEFIVRILDKYKIAKVDNIGLVKYNLGRNVARSPEKFEENRMYYLNKMEYIIKKFDKKQQVKIYNNHYFQIAKEYLRAKKFKQYFKWTNKTSAPIKYYFKTFSDYCSMLKRNKA